jgi:hypothetical protein
VLKEATRTPTAESAVETSTAGGCVLQAAHPPPDGFFQCVALRDWRCVYTAVAADTIPAAIPLHISLRNLVNFTPPPPY